jgi:hypothetical protein
MTPWRRMEEWCIDPRFLDSAIVGDEWSASRPGHFTPGERANDTHCIGGLVGPRAGLNDIEERKFLTLPGLELRPLGRPARSQLLYWLRYPGFCLDDVEKRKFLTLPGLEIRPLCCSARSQSLYWVMLAPPEEKGYIYKQIDYGKVTIKQRIELSKEERNNLIYIAVCRVSNIALSFLCSLRSVRFT